jgi:hypothetical protein
MKYILLIIINRIYFITLKTDRIYHKAENHVVQHNVMDRNQQNLNMKKWNNFNDETQIVFTSWKIQNKSTMNKEKNLCHEEQVEFTSWKSHNFSIIKINNNFKPHKNRFCTVNFPFISACSLWEQQLDLTCKTIKSKFTRFNGWWRLSNWALQRDPIKP